MKKSIIAKYNGRELDFSSDSFLPILQMVNSARNNALRKVNEELITLYQNIGKFLSEESEKHGYGDKFIVGAAESLRQQLPEEKTFSRRTLYRMKQFYEACMDDEIVSAVLTQLSWANHLQILSTSSQKEEYNFYILSAVKEHENPSVGIILCTAANHQGVEYAMSRTISPTLVSKYMPELPVKKLLEKQLRRLEEILGFDEVEKD